MLMCGLAHITVVLPLSDGAVELEILAKDDGVPVLVLAAGEGKEVMTRSLLERVTKVRAILMNQNVPLPLHKAADPETLAAVALLLGHWAEINAQNDSGEISSSGTLARGPSCT